jgi:hypothetical protein
MRSRVLATIGGGIVLAASLSMAPVALADAGSGKHAQVPVIVCKPTSNSYSVSLANTNILAPIQTLTDTIAGALGLHVQNTQSTNAESGTASSVSACEQLAQANNSH